MKISKAAVIRTVILFLSLINMILDACGVKILPIDDETVSHIVSALIVIASSVAAWWKNNSFSEKAIAADEFLKKLKEE